MKNVWGAARYLIIAAISIAPEAQANFSCVIISKDKSTLTVSLKIKDDPIIPSSGNGFLAINDLEIVYDRFESRAEVDGVFVPTIEETIVVATRLEEEVKIEGVISISDLTSEKKESFQLNLRYHPTFEQIECKEVN